MDAVPMAVIIGWARAIEKAKLAAWVKDEEQVKGGLRLQWLPVLSVVIAKKKQN
jgi:hypothetical protein